MISASWPMPKSYVPPVQQESKQDLTIKGETEFSGQEKGKFKDIFSNSEKILLEQVMKELASKLVVESLTKGLIAQIQTHDLDDVYDPKANIPFPQPFLFDDSSL
jgi:hypothetical protein